ncbi:oligosaccharide flippase family protein [Vibrio parahaemolyticus]|nr:oligosaccharide flippase family protein [Vibrio parahaemolyticus]
MKELIEKLFSTTFVKLYSLSLGFVIMFYTLNVLGVEERGEIAIVLSWSSTLFTALYLSLGQIAYRRIKDNHLEINTVCSSLLTFTLLVTVFLIVIIPICYAFFYTKWKGEFITPLLFLLQRAIFDVRTVLSIAKPGRKQYQEDKFYTSD